MKTLTTTPTHNGGRLRLSYVIVTHNRREALLHTLAQLEAATPLPADQWEVWVVDNASTDGTEAAVRAAYPHVRYLRRPTNEGVWARSLAFEPARGEYVVLLDDDSYPVGDAVGLSLAYLDGNPTCAAVVGRVVLPDGSEEGCAFPAVMLSGAVCLRRRVLLPREQGGVGGFRPEFFRKAGEYDLSFRIWQAGYRIERFEDIVYRHDKVMTGRSRAFAHRMDCRNNLILVERYLPRPMRRVYRRDVAQRYSLLARHDGCGRAAWLGRIEAWGWRLREMLLGRQTLAPGAIETLYQWKGQASLVRAWAEVYRPQRVVIADFSKNLYATLRACREAGLVVTAIADDHPAFRGQLYRGLPVLSVREALATAPDGVVVSNINPAQCRTCFARLRDGFRGPVLMLWQPSYVSAHVAGGRATVTGTGALSPGESQVTTDVSSPAADVPSTAGQPPVEQGELDPVRAAA